MTVKNVVIPLEIEYLQVAAKERGISVPGLCVL
jgi:hypothetical protein